MPTFFYLLRKLLKPIWKWTDYLSFSFTVERLRKWLPCNTHIFFSSHLRSNWRFDVYFLLLRFFHFVNSDEMWVQKMVQFQSFFNSYTERVKKLFPRSVLKIFAVIKNAKRVENDTKRRASCTYTFLQVSKTTSDVSVSYTLQINWILYMY